MASDTIFEPPHMRVSVKKGGNHPRILTRLDYQLAYEGLTGVPAWTALQDGLLAYYNSQAPLADANVERRLETEPYQWPYGKSDS